ncbi:hypothetical protein ACFV7R_15235 [Streptomyces sp. NPDC059866]|uniref:hypothetical protein n=1 Tax=Streptomyces sp. NPDC059866 TaxID=3346978 RepID=UPI00364C7E39
MSVGDRSYDGEGGARHGLSGASRLPEELRALGRSLDAPGGAGSGGSESMVERVLEQILAEQLPVPEPPGAGARLRAVRQWTRVRWRSLTAALCGLLTLLAVTPPVRAAVVDWFGFGGVEVRYDPSAVPSPGTEVPGCGRSVSLAQAARRAGFEPLVPDALGPPDAVTVSGAPQGRFLVSLCWREEGRTIRLDEYAASIDMTFVKAVPEQPERLTLDSGSSPTDGESGTALWFARPHLLKFWLVDEDRGRFTLAERTASPTLLWTHGTPNGEVTLRLEGVAAKERAVDVAQSVEEGPARSSEEPPE